MITEKEIIKGNKLIAKAVGEYEIFHWGKDPFNELLKATYHSSWNCLIPVVEEIEKLYDEFHGYFGVHISSNSCTIQGTKLRTDKEHFHPAYFAEHYGKTKIEAVWLAVVEFIKWLNKNKLKC